MTRRGLLRASATLGLAALGPAEAGASAVAAVLYDARFAEARALAARLGGLGVPAFATRGDAAGLWYGALGARLRRRPGWVAGVTTYPDLVIARSCGRELGLRLVCDEGDAGRRLLRWRLGPRG
jgi:hypothetical protein